MYASSFRYYFTPLVGVLFTFPSRYWFTIGRQGVLRLGGWSPHLRTGFHVSRSTQGSSAQLSIRGYHPLWPAFPCRSDRRTKDHWPDPLSLATTYGVSVDVLSSGYLDVSVHRVRLLSHGMSSTCRVAPFGYPRIISYVPIPAAFRSLSRPSSPLRA